MLTDAALKALKPKEKVYKIVDRDGMYVRAAGRAQPLQIGWEFALCMERPAFAHHRHQRVDIAVAAHGHGVWWHGPGGQCGRPSASQSHRGRN